MQSINNFWPVEFLIKPNVVKLTKKILNEKGFNFAQSMLIIFLSTIFSYLYRLSLSWVFIPKNIADNKS